MGTKAAIKFTDENGAQAIVYTQYDGDPRGIQQKLQATIKSELVWTLPRFEADEFAAGFIAANKKYSGGIRVLSNIDDLWCDFLYVVNFNSNLGEIGVTVGHCKGYDELDRPEYVFMWDGRLSTMHTAYAEDAA